jgi:hypothetical protein
MTDETFKLKNLLDFLRSRNSAESLAGSERPTLTSHWRRYKIRKGLWGKMIDLYHVEKNPEFIRLMDACHTHGIECRARGTSRSATREAAKKADALIVPFLAAHGNIRLSSKFFSTNLANWAGVIQKLRRLGHIDFSVFCRSEMIESQVGAGFRQIIAQVKKNLRLVG